MVSDRVHKILGNSMGKKRLKLYFLGGVGLTIINTVCRILTFLNTSPALKVSGALHVILKLSINFVVSSRIKMRFAK